MSEAIVNESHMPKCIGIIMDGNRRWAKGQGLPKLQGHRAGADKLKEIARLCKKRGIEHLIVYAFSTENWNREAAEVSYLMDLFRELIEKEFSELQKEGIRLRIVGQRERFAPDLQASMERLEKETSGNTEGTLWLCLSYGGRAEIVHAANKAVENGMPITEESLAANLWTADMPDPDMIIRTNGEERLSGFLPWQSVYSELFFTPTHWPALTEAEFEALLAEFGERERRHGK